MKKIKKGLLAVPVVLALASSAVVLTACGKKEMKFTQTADIKTKTETVVNGLFENVYNLTNPNSDGSKNVLTSSQLKNKTNDSALAYYVNVGSLKNCDDVTSIKLGETTFTKDQQVSVSIGNSNFVKDVVYSYTNGNLMIAAPILAMETATNATLKINDKSFTLNITAQTSGVFENVSFVDNANTWTKDNDVYNITIVKPDVALELSYGTTDTPATVEDQILTRQVSNGATNYGLTKPESNCNLALYTTNWTQDINKVDDSFHDRDWDFTAYIKNKGVKNIKLHVNVAKPKMTAAQNIQANAKATVDELVEKAYNNTDLGSGQKISIDTLNTTLVAHEVEPIENYYTEVATLTNFRAVTSLKLGELTFTSTQTTDVSIGNSNKIRDLVFKYEDDKLKIAAPILLYEATSLDKIEINGVEYPLVLENEDRNVELERVEYLKGQTSINTATKEGDVYKLNIKDAADALAFYYEGAEVNDVALTKKVLDGTLNGYGLTKVENVEQLQDPNKYPFAFYVTNYTTDLSQVEDKYKGATWDYSIYVVGKGMVSTKLNVNVAETVATLAEFQSALANQKVSDIIVTSDIDVTSQLVVNRKVNLDLNGHTLSNSTDIWVDVEDETKDVWSLISVKEGGDLTITGNGRMAAKANDCYPVDVYGGRLTIKDGTFVGNIHAVYVHHGSAEIYGGNYSIQQSYPDSSKAKEFTLNLYDPNRENGTATLKVYGGSYEGFNPADCYAEGEHTNFVEEGYKVTEISGVYVVSHPIHVSDRSELNNALYFKSVDGSYVVLDEDIVFDLDPQAESFPVGLYCKAKATLDLNGHSIIIRATEEDTEGKIFSKVKSAFTLYKGADLTVVGEGTLDCADARLYGFYTSGGAKLTIKNGTFRGYAHTVYVLEGEAEILGGDYTVVDKHNTGVTKGQFLLNLFDANRTKGTAKMTVYGGTFHDFNPANNRAEGENTNFVAEGYQVTEQVTENDKVYVVSKSTQAE